MARRPAARWTKRRWRAWQPREFPCTRWVSGRKRSTNDLELEQLQVPGTGVAGETLRATVSIRHQEQRSTACACMTAANWSQRRMWRWAASAGLTSANVEFPAGKAGLRDLRVVVDTARDETNVANNARRALVEVSDRRRSILYIEGEPRWEYKFIRRAIEADKSLRLVSVVRATPNRYYRQGVTSAADLEDGFPRTAAELDSYDAVIIGSLEAAALSTEQHEWLRDFVDRRGGSLLMLAGRDGMGDGGWGRVPVGPLLPSVLPRGATPSYGARASQVRLTTYGAASAVGQLDADPTKNAAQWATLPALADFQSLGRLRPGAIVLLEAAGRGSRRSAAGDAALRSRRDLAAGHGDHLALADAPAPGRSAPRAVLAADAACTVDAIAGAGVAARRSQRGRGRAAGARG